MLELKISYPMCPPIQQRCQISAWQTWRQQSMPSCNKDTSSSLRRRKDTFINFISRCNNSTTNSTSSCQNPARVVRPQNRPSVTYVHAHTEIHTHVHSPRCDLIAAVEVPQCCCHRFVQLKYDYAYTVYTKWNVFCDWSIFSLRFLTHDHLPFTRACAQPQYQAPEYPMQVGVTFGSLCSNAVGVFTFEIVFGVIGLESLGMIIGRWTCLSNMLTHFRMDITGGVEHRSSQQFTPRSGMHVSVTYE